MAGLLASERAGFAQPSSRALADPRSAIKITTLEIIPVHSLRSIFVKMHTDAGIIGLGEGTVEGKIETVVAAIQQLEPYLVGKDPRSPAHHWQAMYRHGFYRGVFYNFNSIDLDELLIFFRAKLAFDLDDIRHEFKKILRFGFEDRKSVV